MCSRKRFINILIEQQNEETIFPICQDCPTIIAGVEEILQENLKIAEISPKKQVPIEKHHKVIVLGDGDIANRIMQLWEASSTHHFKASFVSIVLAGSIVMQLGRAPKREMSRTL